MTLNGPPHRSEAARQRLERLEQQFRAGALPPQELLSRTLELLQSTVAEMHALGRGLYVARQRTDDEAGLAFLADAGAALAESLDHDAVLRRLTQLALPRLADWCAVEVVAEDAPVVEVVLAHADAEKTRLASGLPRWHPLPPDCTRWPTKAYRTGQSVLLADASPDHLAAFARGPRHLEILSAYGLRSAVVVPLRAESRVLGSLTLALTGRHLLYTLDDLALAEHFGRSAALALANARRHQSALDAAREHRHHEAQLTAARDRLATQLLNAARLQELTVRLLASLEYPQVLAEILAALPLLQGCEMGAVYLYDPERDELHAAASMGLSDNYLRAAGRFAPGSGGLGAAVPQRRPVLVEDVQTHPLAEAHRAAALAAGIRAAFGIPLFAQDGSVLGVLAGFYPEQHQPVPGETRLVELYARQAGIALENARRFQRATGKSAGLA